MDLQPRSADAWRTLASRVLALAFAVVGVVVEHGLGVAFLCVALALLLVPFAWRRRAANLPGAIYSGSADLLLPGGRQMPGELSFTTTTLGWIPSRYSRERGIGDVSVPIHDASSMSLSCGRALFDLVLTTTASEGEELRFLTHTSRRLRRAVRELPLDEPAPPEV